MSEKAVFKYTLSAEEAQQFVEMPRDAEILCVQTQDGRPCLWALVDPTAESIKRDIRIYGIGHPIQEHGHRYIGTYQLWSGKLVFHVFEAK